jgi:hypothetical protein
MPRVAAAVAANRALVGCDSHDISRRLYFAGHLRSKIQAAAVQLESTPDSAAALTRAKSRNSANAIAFFMACQNSPAGPDLSRFPRRIHL